MRSNHFFGRSGVLTTALAGLGVMLGGCADTADGMDPEAQPAAQAEEARTAVTLRFKGVVGKEDFACGRVYAGQGTTAASITPQDFRFFVQDVRLLAEDGTEVPVKLEDRGNYQAANVALLDFATNEGQCSRGDQETNLTVTGSVPAGKYRGVVFVNGVPDSLNHADPATAPAPLKLPGMSWGWLMGYKFMLASAIQDRPIVPVPPTTDVARPGTAVAQIGSSACGGNPAVSISCQKPNRNEVRLTDFELDKSTIVADFGAIFAGSDLKARSECHSDGSATCAPMFSALGIDLATGKALATQSVFRVE